MREFYHKGLGIRKGKKECASFYGSSGLDSAGKESTSYANNFLDIPVIGLTPKDYPLR
jgi:hypothetical protein